jgi:NADH:ubiquinone oxidoreductase subunit 4 (subunit M)
MVMLDDVLQRGVLSGFSSLHFVLFYSCFYPLHVLYMLLMVPVWKVKRRP